MDKSDLIFWTGILADHAEFQTNAFSPREESYIQEAINFHSTFERYHKAAQATVDSTMLSSLTDDVVRFIEFKKKIITELLRCNVLINFSPGFLNHMVNEASEFLSLLNENTTCPENTKFPATYIKIWIADASGHTTSILSSLDASETLLLENTQFYKTKFDHIYKKSVELEMIQDNMRGLKNHQLLKAEAVDAFKRFIAFCKELVTLLDNCNALKAGTFSSMMVNHFIKEHEYVIEKISACL